MKKLMMLVLGVFVMTSFAFATGDKSATGNVTIKVYRDFNISLTTTLPTVPQWMIIGDKATWDFNWDVTGESEFTLDWAMTCVLTTVSGTNPVGFEAGWPKFGLDAGTLGATASGTGKALSGTFPGAGSFTLQCQAKVEALASGEATLTATATVGNYTHF